MLTIIVARYGSDRYPGKVMAEIDGLPLLGWLAKRLAPVSASVVIATTAEKEDDAIAWLAKTLRLDVHRHSPPDDVVGRVAGACAGLGQRELVFPALGDCPFPELDIINRAAAVLGGGNHDRFAWLLPPETLPVYGAREFPRTARIMRSADTHAETRPEREHIDFWLDRYRHRYEIVYHYAPPTVYFRPYRLEVDYPADIELVRRVAEGVGMLASLKQVIKFLDRNQDVARLNANCVEKTGPVRSHDYQTRREWFYQMTTVPVVMWNGTVITPNYRTEGAPVFCAASQCAMGFVAPHTGHLRLLQGGVVEKGFVPCECGAGLKWGLSTTTTIGGGL